MVVLQDVVVVLVEAVVVVVVVVVVEEVVWMLDRQEIRLYGDAEAEGEAEGPAERNRHREGPAQRRTGKESVRQSIGGLGVGIKGDEYSSGSGTAKATAAGGRRSRLR